MLHHGLTTVPLTSLLTLVYSLCFHWFRTVDISVWFYVAPYWFVCLISSLDFHLVAGVEKKKILHYFRDVYEVNAFCNKNYMRHIIYKLIITEKNSINVIVNYHDSVTPIPNGKIKFKSTNICSMNFSLCKAQWTIYEPNPVTTIAPRSAT
jgi:hypothetical protein